MSSDNYYVIQPYKDGRWGIWMQCASSDEKDFTKKPMWNYSTLEKAIAKAQREYSEYGFRIRGLGNKTVQLD